MIVFGVGRSDSEQRWVSASSASRCARRPHVQRVSYPTCAQKCQTSFQLLPEVSIWDVLQ